jgi:DNA-binding transcriptional LysR family regulator
LDWDDVRHFLALARTGSVRAAGARLEVSHSTVARRVEALEARLGVRLFDRHRDGYLLTAAGSEMVISAERVELEMSALERGLAGQDTRLEGAVRVTCTDPQMAQILLSGLTTFCHMNSGIELEIEADSRYSDLSRREADVALRALPPNSSPPEHLIGRRVAPITVCSYVARAHAQAIGPESGAMRWLGSSRRKIMEVVVASSSYPHVPIWGSFEGSEVLLAAARAGLGCVILPTYMADPDPELVRLDRPDLRHMADFWLLSHADLRDNARLRAAREVIQKTLATRDPLFRGELTPR